MVKLQYAECPGATGIARGWHRGVSSMRPDDTTMPGSFLRPCEHCGSDIRVFRSREKTGHSRFCNRGCYRAYLIALAPPIIGSDGDAYMPLLNKDRQVQGYARIDLADLEWARQWRWCMARGGYAARSGGAAMGGSRTLMHRELMGLTREDKREVDHINRDRLDNRRSNLRVTDHRGNCQNTSAQKGSTSKYRGVSWSTRHRCWVATVKVGGRSTTLGYFKNEEDAAACAISGRRELLPDSFD